MLLKFMVALLLLMASASAEAIQLHWASGSANLSFATATRCTLVVEADSIEFGLPAEWHLLWAASHCGHLPIIVDTAYTDSSIAHVAEVLSPTPAEAAANVGTAALQADMPTMVTAAQYILDLPSESAGKFQVVACAFIGNNPTPSIARSQVVTFNGGPDAALPPAIIAAQSDQPATRVTINVQGVGLANATAASIVAPDTSWRIPLEIDASTDSTLSASADVMTGLPKAVLQLTVGGGSGSAALLVSSSCGAGIAATTATTQYNSVLYADPRPNASTKDFAVFYNTVHSGGRTRDLFHLMYIRHIDPTGAEPGLAHAWSKDLFHWTVDTLAFLPIPSSGTRWDRFSVWAPSIIQQGDSTFMFYTGVDINSDQTIGYASTASFDTCNTDWTRYDTSTWSAESTLWAATRRYPLSNLGRQFRDPYVFRHPNPDSLGTFFLVFAAVDSAHAINGTQAVGVARNRTRGSLSRWWDLGYYRSTDQTRTDFGQIEGPIIFPDRGSATGWLAMFSNASPPTGYTTARFSRQTPGSLPWDTTLALWSYRPDTLYKYLGDDATVYGWEGTEYLRVADNIDYLAGFTSFGVLSGPAVQGIAISRLSWNTQGNGRTFSLGAGSVTAVDEVGSPGVEIRMNVVEFRPRARRISWRITVPTATAVRLDIYDVTGRSRRKLLDQVLPAGASIATWDTADMNGAVVMSGMYYARLTFEGGVRLCTLPIIR